MRYTALIAGALCIAGVRGDNSPPQTEYFSIVNFTYKKAADGTVSDIQFLGYTKDNDYPLVCEVRKPQYPEPKVSSTCGDAVGNEYYSFAVHFKGTNSVRVRIYDQWSKGVGLWGEATIPIVCHETEHACYGVGNTHQGSLEATRVTLQLGDPPNWP